MAVVLGRCGIALLVVGLYARAVVVVVVVRGHDGKKNNAGLRGEGVFLGWGEKQVNFQTGTIPGEKNPLVEKQENKREQKRGCDAAPWNALALSATTRNLAVLRGKARDRWK